jgi:hypothetical protein
MNSALRGGGGASAFRRSRADWDFPLFGRGDRYSLVGFSMVQSMLEKIQKVGKCGGGKRVW